MILTVTEGRIGTRKSMILTKNLLHVSLCSVELILRYVCTASVPEDRPAAVMNDIENTLNCCGFNTAM